MKRTLDEGDVSQRHSKPHRVGVALRTTALARQQNDRKVGPGRLLVQPSHQFAQVGGFHRFVGDDGEAGAGRDLLNQRIEVGTNDGRKARFVDQARGHGRIAPGRREDDGTLGRLARSHAAGSSSRGRA
ncbi:hypothetical protein [Bradyrhizobium manausense]|uniref:hypothetical protein n=1 Tax=Bradyrhizobium manausense TaxID=989370 RepID=UPI002012367B|nr:hypothetical protein [Bradyrhizobium manausense]